jgi:hypothetical protein
MYRLQISYNATKFESRNDAQETNRNIKNPVGMPKNICGKDRVATKHVAEKIERKNGGNNKENSKPFLA